MSYRKISCVIKRKKRLIKNRIGENVIKLKFFNFNFYVTGIFFFKIALKI